MTDVLVPSFLDLSDVPIVAPAPRKPVLDRVMLIDNGRLEPTFGHYYRVFDVLREHLLGKFPDVGFSTFSGRLSAFTEAELAEIVTSCVDQGVDAAVIALCDIGVSQPSTILAGLLERAGIPVCLVCQGIGVQLVDNTSRSLGQTIPHVDIESIWTASEQALRAEFAGIMDTLVHNIVADVPAPAQPERSSPRSGTVSLAGVDLGTEFTDYMAERDLGDGLPMVAPTSARVDAVLAALAMDGSEVVWPALATRSTPVTVRDVAIVSVLAGCKPEWAWAVVAAYQAMAAPEFRLASVAITTHPGGFFVLVSGPRAEASGISGGPGCLGPGYPANATIGRAVALGTRVFLGAVQGAGDLTRQGSASRFSFCCGENQAASPWPSLSRALTGADTTTVTVLKCESGRNVMDHVSALPETLLDSFAGNMSSISSNNAFNPTAQTVVVMNPLHARLIADGGWSREDVQHYLYETVRTDPAAIRGRGSVPRWPAWFKHLDRVPVVLAPEDILIVVAGGDGPQSQIMIPWGYSRGVTVTVPQP